MAGTGSAVFFSLGNAVVATTGAFALTCLCILAASVAVVLLAWAYYRGESMRDIPWSDLAWLAVPSFCEVSLYFIAIQLASPGPVTAIHLCVPVLLMLLALLQGERTVGRREIAIIVGILLGLTTIALGRDQGGDSDLFLLGIGLAFFSAIGKSICYLQMQKRALAFQAQPHTLNALQNLLLVIGALPFLFLLPPTGNQTMLLLLIGAGFTAPAAAAWWYASTRINPITASSLSLLGVPATAVIAFALGASLTSYDIIATGFILTAIWLEIHRRQSMASPAISPAILPEAPVSS